MTLPRRPLVRIVSLFAVAAAPVAGVSGCQGDDNPPVGSISVPRSGSGGLAKAEVEPKPKAEVEPKPKAEAAPKKPADPRRGMGVKERLGLDK
jgi:hypothetical protein